MSGYKPIRLSSPHREGLEHGEEHELEGGQYQDTDGEQREGLLGSDRDEEDTYLEPIRKVGGRTICLVGLLALFATAIIVGLSLLVRSLVHNLGKASHDMSTDFRRPDSAYVLDPNWDYHATPKVRTYNWVIQDIVANPDGVFRPMITINGKFPGEMIRCNDGDTVIVNVENQAVNATSIHWHGIFQNGSNWMDGVPGVTQCPIAPGKKFQYKFTIQGQSGTCE